MRHETQTQEAVAHVHSFVETRPMSPRDILLRKNGFKIESRPRVGKTLWRLAEKVYTEFEALQLCKA